MEVHVTIDRIEGDVAVLEVNGRTVDWPLAALPAGVAEGSVIRLAFTIDDPDLDAASARLARLRSRSDADDDIDL